MITVRSTPNIALIKYWGNRNDELRLPMNDSLAMVLDTPSVEVSVSETDLFSVRSFNPDGTEKELNDKSVSRFQKHYQLCNQYLQSLGAPENTLPNDISIEIHSAIPPAIGLASSSAVFSAAGKAYAQMAKGSIDLTDEQVSVLARLGSGSAARGIHDGFVATTNREGDSIGDAVGEQIAGTDHWQLHDIIIAPSKQEKKVGSSEGHPGAHSSPHYEARVQAIKTRRQQECVDAILNKDFEKLQAVSEEDCMDMHNVMQTQAEPLHYLSDDTYRIIEEIKELRATEHLPVLYTMDAGPTVHLFCTEESRERIAQYANAQEGCTIFQTTVGRGAHVV